MTHLIMELNSTNVLQKTQFNVVFVSFAVLCAPLKMKITISWNFFSLERGFCLFCFVFFIMLCPSPVTKFLTTSNSLTLTWGLTNSRRIIRRLKLIWRLRLVEFLVLYMYRLMLCVWLQIMISVTSTLEKVDLHKYME